MKHISFYMFGDRVLMKLDDCFFAARELREIFGGFGDEWYVRNVEMLESFKFRTRNVEILLLQLLYYTILLRYQRITVFKWTNRWLYPKRQF